jgi:hypothetical protein
MKMNRRQGIISMLAAGGLMLASQQAGAVIVTANTDLELWDAGLNFESTGYFEGGGGYIYEATADSDSNLFAALGVADGTGWAGWANGVDPDAIKFFGGYNLANPIPNGTTVRMSAWVMSNPNDPFTNVGGEDGFKMEFLDVAQGNGVPDPDPLLTDLIVVSALEPVGTAPLSTTGWTQKSLTVELNTVIHDLANLAEIRPVMVQAGGPGATGEIFVDNYYFEVFDTLALANAAALPGSAPGGFDVPPPPLVLNGDIAGGGVGGDEPDGFVGIADLNQVLGNWNAGTPPNHAGEHVLHDFSGFALTGNYEAWGAGTFTDNGTDWSILANDFGGGWFDLPATLDASGTTALELTMSVNAGNVSDKFNIVLIDADGTERVYRFEGANLMVGDNQVLEINLDNFLQDNAAGSTPGLDLASLVSFHVQGSFGNGNPGNLLDLTLDNLALIIGVPPIVGDITGDGFVGIADLNVVLTEWNLGTPPPSGGASVPEPATLSLLALGGLAMLRRRSA